MTLGIKALFVFEGGTDYKCSETPVQVPVQLPVQVIVLCP